MKGVCRDSLTDFEMSSECLAFRASHVVYNRSEPRQNS